MTSRSLRIGSRLLSVTLLILASSSIQSDVDAARKVKTSENINPLLTPCSLFEKSYNDLGFASNNFDNWPTIYHEKVAEVVEEHLKDLSITAKCDAEKSEDFLKAGSKLEELANKLPTWKKSGAKVKYTDAGMVLLEYLRSYECILKERQYFISIDSLEYMKSRLEENITHPNVFAEQGRESSIIEKQLILSRKILNRTLTYLGGIDRFLPLDAELQCVQRASLDIRNAAALAAETSTCLPRIWNNRDPLRDIP